jgi:hypothetical protein
MNMEIGVYFLGVCTHVWWDEPPVPYTKRVVLVNGSGVTPIHGKNIQPHIATLRIAAADIDGLESLDWPGTINKGVIEWRLDGERVHIENAIGGDTEPDDSFFTCMPHLRLLTTTVGPPSRAAIEDLDPGLTSCIFDLTGGTMYGRANESEAMLGLLKAETTGAPRLSITPFGGQSRTIQLKPGAEITFSNLGATPEDDDRFDFYLHYQLAEQLPTTVLGIPEHGRTGCVVFNDPIKTWPAGFGSVGPGCSNSAYP